MKFALYTYSGEQNSFYQVEIEQIKTAGAVVSGDSGHLIVVVDRSGSMWGSLDQVKRIIEESLTSASSGNLLVSLVSYSSEGDATVHFTRSPIATLSQSGSAELRQLRSIRPTGLTCISGGLDTALSLVQDGEATVIALHSDGYANDASSYTERRTLDALIGSTNNPNLSVHTVAHSTWSDFQTLSRIANSLSGSCVYAQSSKDVEIPMNNIVSDVKGSVEAPFTVEAKDEDFLIFYSKSGRRINASVGDLQVSNLAEGSDKTIFRYKKITKSQFNSSSEEDCVGSTEKRIPVYLMSRAMVTLGKLNLAKYALISTQDEELIEAHYRALVNEELAEMVSAIDDVAFDKGGSRSYGTSYGLSSIHSSVLEIFAVLQHYATDFEVDVKKLRSIYRRRTLQRIPGKRDRSTGVFTNLDFETRPIETDPFIEVAAFEINQNSANINMTISDPVQLYKKAGKKPILKVSGVDVSSLREYRAFTLVGDGRLNVDQITLRIHSKEAHDALSQVGAISGSYKKSGDYVIDFTDRPMVPFDQQFSSLDGMFERLMELRLMNGALTALLKDSSSEFSDQQIKDLRSHYLSKSLNVNFPTTTPYDDLDDAISKGEVERMPRYVIDIGNTTIQNKADFRSANAALKSFYAFDGSAPSKTPKWEHLTESSVKLKKKKLSKRTKVSTADELAVSIYDELVGIKKHSIVSRVLTSAGASHLKSHFDALANRKMNASVLDGLAQASQLLEAEMDRRYAREVSPMVFYIGSTGILPDEFEAKAYTAEDLEKKYPHLMIQKNEQNGTFFVFDKNIISVFVKDEIVNRS